MKTNKQETPERPADAGCVRRLVRLPVLKWKMGRLRERAGEGWTSPLVWWVRETEAKQKLRDLKCDVEKLRAGIKEAWMIMDNVNEPRADEWQNKWQHILANSVVSSYSPDGTLDK